MTVTMKAGKFFGTNTSTLDVSGFHFKEQSYESELRLPAHGHERPHFCFVLSGRYTETVERKAELRTESARAFYPSGVTHSETHHAAGRHFIVEIDPRRSEALSDGEDTPDDVTILTDAGTADLFSKLYSEFLRRDRFSALALEGLMLELLAATARRRMLSLNRPPRWLDSVTERLRADFSNPPTLKDLSLAVGIHPSHLVRGFRRFHGCTVGEFVRRVRIEQARRLLVETSDELVEIALVAGFFDQSHFSRSFKAETGMTPAQYRSRFQER